MKFNDNSYEAWIEACLEILNSLPQEKFNEAIKILKQLKAKKKEVKHG